MMYLWLKAFHIIAVIAWMAGMLYLPRLFVYHCEAAPGSPQSETFKVMERRLLQAIINPAMIATWVLGLWLAWGGTWWPAHWLHAKIALVVAMSAVHGVFARWVKDFAADRNTRSAEFLPRRQRGSDGADDPHRHSGGGQAVLINGRSCGRADANGVRWRDVRPLASAAVFPYVTHIPRTQADACEGLVLYDRPAHRVEEAPRFVKAQDLRSPLSLPNPRQTISARRRLPPKDCPACGK